MDFTTADNIINDAAVELALKSADIADPFGSTDPNILLLCRLLKRVGRALVRARDWSHLTKEYTFATVNGTASYALPTDYARMKNQTHWNRSTSMPLGGPVDSRSWQAMKATTASGTVIRPFRVFGNLLYLYPTPTTAENIYYEYISKRWVVPTGQTVPTTTEPTVYTDTLWFDETLLVFGLKLAFLRAKGWDTSHAQDEFNQAYAAEAGGDGSAAVLDISGRPGFRLLDGNNLPDSGYGS